MLPLTPFCLPLCPCAPPTPGENDQLASPNDIDALVDELGFDDGTAAEGSTRMRVTGYEHLDFVWADNADARVYGQILDFLGEQAR